MIIHIIKSHEKYMELISYNVVSTCLSFEESDYLRKTNLPLIDKIAVAKRRMENRMTSSIKTKIGIVCGLIPLNALKILKTDTFKMVQKANLTRFYRRFYASYGHPEGITLYENLFPDFFPEERDMDIKFSRYDNFCHFRLDSHIAPSFYLEILIPDEFLIPLSNVKKRKKISLRRVRICGRPLMNGLRASSCQQTRDNGTNVLIIDFSSGRELKAFTIQVPCLFAPLKI